MGVICGVVKGVKPGVDNGVDLGVDRGVDLDESEEPRVGKSGVNSGVGGKGLGESKSV